MDMINRLKQNRAQRPSNRPKFKENYREGIYSSKNKFKPQSLRPVSEKELAKIKNNIRERAKLQRKNEQIMFGILIVFVVTLIIGILVWVN